jgi:Domain of unknown function (DUF5605)
LVAVSSPRTTSTPGGTEGEYYLCYFGVHQPAVVTLRLPEGNRYRGEIIDTWEMEITPIQETLEGECTVELPGKPYMAAQLRKVEANSVVREV